MAACSRRVAVRRFHILSFQWRRRRVDGRVRVGVVVPLGTEVHARLDEVVGLGPALDLTGDIGQGGVDPVTLGTSLDAALLMVRQDHFTGAVTIAHRFPLSKVPTDLLPFP